MGDMENRITETDLVDFVRHCQNRYFDLGLEPTEEAHSPLPKCMGGTGVVLLTRQDHAKHDVLQTECYGEGTLTPWYFKELIGTSWEQRAEKALSVRQSQSGKSGGKACFDRKLGRNSKEAILKGIETQRNKRLGMYDPNFHSAKNKSASGKKGCKVTNSQKWMCTVSGRISSPGPLTIIQRSLGIDPSNRIKI